VRRNRRVGEQVAGARKFTPLALSPTRSRPLSRLLTPPSGERTGVASHCARRRLTFLEKETPRGSLPDCQRKESTPPPRPKGAAPHSLWQPSRERADSRRALLLSLCAGLRVARADAVEDRLSPPVPSSVPGVHTDASGRSGELIAWIYTPSSTPDFGLSEVLATTVPRWLATTSVRYLAPLAAPLWRTSGLSHTHRASRHT
jgi:hypothetical protein